MMTVSFEAWRTSIKATAGLSVESRARLVADTDPVKPVAAPTTAQAVPLHFTTFGLRLAAASAKATTGWSVESRARLIQVTAPDEMPAAPTVCSGEAAGREGGAGEPAVPRVVRTCEWQNKR